MSYFRYLIVMAMCFLFLDTASAQQIVNPDRNKPLEITADETLEWHRDLEKYIARGNVIARQGDVTITAETLTADYRETSASAFEIYRLSANGNVKISSRGNIAYGEKAIYEVDRGVAVMTGNNLELKSPDQSVKASDSFEYWVSEGKLTAIGNAHVVRLQDTLDADRVSATFKEDQYGTRQLEKLTANGNVRITTPTEILTGDKGSYDASTNIAQIIGGVKITRGPNILEGERAEVNLATNVSKMHGGAPSNSGQSKGRVRGVFYPDGSKSITPANEPKASQNEGQKGPLLLGQ